MRDERRGETKAPIPEIDKSEGTFFWSNDVPFDWEEGWFQSERKEGGVE